MWKKRRQSAPIAASTFQNFIWHRLNQAKATKQVAPRHELLDFRKPRAFSKLHPGACSSPTKGQECGVSLIFSHCIQTTPPTPLHTATRAGLQSRQKTLPKASSQIAIPRQVLSNHINPKRLVGFASKFFWESIAAHRTPIPSFSSIGLSARVLE